MVNFLSLFCPELQKCLKLIYNLTRKDRQFIWAEEQQNSFEEIKKRLQEPLVLYFPDSKGKYHLYSDMSNFVRGSALYKTQNAKQKLVSYASKRMPETAKIYSITELDLCAFARNIVSIVPLMKKVDFDAIAYHIALIHIIKDEAEPATNNCAFSSYSFNMNYIKGKT